MRNLSECATTARTIWQNVLKLPTQSGRMSIIGQDYLVFNIFDIILLCR